MMNKNFRVHPNELLSEPFLFNQIIDFRNTFRANFSPRSACVINPVFVIYIALFIQRHDLFEQRYIILIQFDAVMNRSANHIKRAAICYIRRIRFGF